MSPDLSLLIEVRTIVGSLIDQGMILSLDVLEWNGISLLQVIVYVFHGYVEFIESLNKGLKMSLKVLLLSKDAVLFNLIWFHFIIPLLLMLMFELGIAIIDLRLTSRNIINKL